MLPHNNGLRFLVIAWMVLFVAWFILGLVIQSKDDSFAQTTGIDAASTFYNLQVLALEFILAAILLSTCYGADWTRRASLRKSAKYASVATFLTWFIILMPAVDSALRRDSDACSGDYYCQSLKTTAAFACIAVVLHFLTMLWAFYFDNSIRRQLHTHATTTTANRTPTTAVTVTNDHQHDHAMCEEHGIEPSQPVVLGLLSFSLLGLFLWALGVFIVVAGNKSAGFSYMPVSFFALFFCVVCALAPLAHTSRFMGSIAFWWTVWTTIFGWSLIILALRQANNFDCGDYACRSTILSIAGAAILLFTLTLLSAALFFYYLFQDHAHEHNKTAMRDPNKGVVASSAVSPMTASSTQYMGVPTSASPPTQYNTTQQQQYHPNTQYNSGAQYNSGTQYNSGVPQRQTVVDIDSTTVHNTGETTYTHKGAVVVEPAR